jgi:transcriptional regulator with XRE-family HTH domain
MVKRFEDPNRADPLAEPTINLRVWALYLARGFTRASFARAMGVHYNIVTNWDTGRTSMSLVHFLRACEVIGVLPTELAYGNDGPPPTEREHSLTDVEIRELLDRLEPKPDARESRALDQWRRENPSQRLTATLIRTLVTSYRTALRGGYHHEDALTIASDAALAARATRTAAEDGVQQIDVAALNKRKPRKRKKVDTVPLATTRRIMPPRRH